MAAFRAEAFHALALRAFVDRDPVARQFLVQLHERNENENESGAAAARAAADVEEGDANVLPESAPTPARGRAPASQAEGEVWAAIGVDPRTECTQDLLAEMARIQARARAEAHGILRVRRVAQRVEMLESAQRRAAATTADQYSARKEAIRRLLRFHRNGGTPDGQPHPSQAVMLATMAHVLRTQLTTAAGDAAVDAEGGGAAAAEALPRCVHWRVPLDVLVEVDDALALAACEAMAAAMQLLGVDEGSQTFSLHVRPQVSDRALAVFLQFIEAQRPRTGAAERVTHGTVDPAHAAAPLRAPHAVGHAGASDPSVPLVDALALGSCPLL